jgi:transcriptional regulatory protein GAL4
MEVKLLNWRHSLPRYFTSGTVPEWFLGPRAMVLWKELNLHMMLWRTSQRHHSTEAGKSVADLKCYAAAAQTIKDITIFCQEHVNVMHVSLNWYATYYLFQAILILQLSQLESPSPVQAGFPNALAERVPWSDSIEQGRGCLQMLNTGSSAAGRCLETLDRVRGISTTANPANASFDVADGQTNGMNHHPKVSVPDSIPEMVSSEPLDMSWSMSADPSLSVLVNDPQMDEMFRGIEGFPGILDQDSFNYMAGYLYDF